LEVARRLEDLELCRFDRTATDAQVERPLAFDASEVADVARQVFAAWCDDGVMHRTAPSGWRGRSGREAHPPRRSRRGTAATRHRIAPRPWTRRTNCGS